MKTSNFLKSAGRWLGLSCLLVSVALATVSAAVNQPHIASIQIAGEQVVIAVQVPPGVAKVTLESRARLGAGTWEPRAVARPSGPGQITFTLPKSPSLELMRVRADASEPLPAFFYRGTSNYTGEITSAPGSDAGYLFDGTRTDVSLGVNVPAAETTKTRDVVESDIWKVEGNTLFFFNQYQGLQVIDISQPEAPFIRGSLSLPASGEQMYVLGTNYVVLLARDGCYGSDSRIVIVNVSAAIPTVVATLPVSGQIQESRLVGTALYVAANAYRPVTDKTDYWEWGTQISSFDLAQPESPAAKGTLWYAGYGNVIMATDRFLFVVVTDGNDWNHSLVQYVDISSPDGAMQALSRISPAGRVDDKFKMNLSGDVFTVVSGYWDQARSQRINIIETFSLATPTAPVKLSNPGLQVGNGEQLHATRFDGDRLYVVTFFRVDPLWVIDLSHPAKPAIIGELQVPGWSTYIQPLGNRLVTIGIDNSNSWRVAVSLFDVENPAKPSLIGKVPLGENSSWSEATYDEKAFSVLPDAGLILVPYQGYLTNGYATRVQLIDLKLDDLTTNALVQRGAIEHQFQPRRATVYQNYILSISGKELMTVNAVNRDKPMVVAQTELAWNTDRVFVQGDYLLEIAGGSSYYYYWWDQSTAPGIRVALASDPNTILARFDLTNTLPIIGATVKDGRLFLAQGPAGYAMPYMLVNKSDPSQPEFVTNTPSLYLSVFDLTALPALVLTGQTQVASDTGWGGTLQALWVKNNLLVWAGGENYWNGWYALDMVAGGSARIGLWYPWYRRSAGGRLAAFNVANPAAPTFLSETNLMATNSWSYSTAFTTGGLVYISHQASEFVEDIVSLDPAGVNQTDPIKDPGTIQPLGHWVQKYYLDVIDYADPALPTVRKPVGLPGQLTGLSHDGAVVYARGYHVAANGTRDYSVEWMDACAYDGVSAALIDSLALSKEWPRPALVQGNYLFLGSADSTTNQLNRLETWTLSDLGRFTRLSAFSQKSAANVFAVFGNLLAVQNYDSSYELLDMTNPLKLVLVGHNPAGSCWYGNLTYADGLLDRGLWIPLGDYGVMKVDVTSPKP